MSVNSFFYFNFSNYFFAIVIRYSQTLIKQPSPSKVAGNSFQHVSNSYTVKDEHYH